MEQFKIRKINGVTDIRLADNLELRLELSRIMSRYAPLLSEKETSIPSFDALKITPAATDFIEVQANAGTYFTFNLHVSGVGNVILEKEVLLIDQTKKVRAISRWHHEEGITFTKTS